MLTVNWIRSRDDGIEVTLLPIPNRKVKVYSADGTARVTVWQSRTLRGKHKDSRYDYLFYFGFKKLYPRILTNVESSVDNYKKSKRICG